jgi:hypothetical protein
MLIYIRQNGSQKEKNLVMLLSVNLCHVGRRFDSLVIRRPSSCPTVPLLSVTRNDAGSFPGYSPTRRKKSSTQLKGLI